MKRTEDDFEAKVLRARDGCGIILAMLVFSAIVGKLMATADRGDQVSVHVVTTEARLERLERRQRELDDRMDRLSSSLRASVLPIGWDVPRDGGAQ